ncbi:MAG: YceI family protein [Bacteroidota bacterium]|nr:YceI family protein [Bacteroidota bacterium]
MKSIKLLLVIVSVLAIALPAVRAQVFTVKSYKLSVQGTSSLHDWESTVEKVEARGFYQVSNNTLASIRDVVVKIPVKAIKSPKGKIMDNKTWEAFNYEKNPTITFVLGDKKIDAVKSTVVATGTLTMAGVTKPAELHLTYKVLPGGELEISGSYKLLMSTFNMEAPTAMMGTIKVGDEIVVTIEMLLANPNSTL